MTYARQDGDSLYVDISVHPRAKLARIGPVHGDRLKVAIVAPPVVGKANRAVVALFAKQFGCAKRDIEILQGESARQKTLKIAGVSLEELQRVLAS